MGKNDHESTEAGAYKEYPVYTNEVYILRMLIYLFSDRPTSHYLFKFISLFDHYTLSQFYTPYYGPEEIYYCNYSFFEKLVEKGLLKTFKPIFDNASEVTFKKLRSSESVKKYEKLFLDEYLYSVDKHSLDMCDFLVKKEDEFSWIYWTFEFSADGIGKIKEWLNNYLELFISNKLHFLHTTMINYLDRFYSYDNSVLFLKEAIKDELAIYPHETLIPIEFKRIRQRKFYFDQKMAGNIKEEKPKNFDDIKNWFTSPCIRLIETIFCLEKEGYLDIQYMFPDKVVVDLKRNIEFWCKEDVVIPQLYDFIDLNPKESKKDANFAISPPKEELAFIEEDGYGYLIIKDKKIKIGKLNTRKCKLLKSLSPFGVTKSVDGVFSDMLIEKDKENSRLIDMSTSENTRKTIILQTRSEIYRILKSKRLAGFLSIRVKNKEVKIEIAMK